MDRDSKTGLCLGEAFDWESRRTKAVFLGSAASMALVAALCVWVVEVVVAQIDMDFTEWDVDPWLRIFLNCAIFFPAAFFLARRADRHWPAEADRERDGPLGSRRHLWDHRERSRWETRAEVIWFFTALLVYLVAARIVFGLPISRGAGDKDFYFIGVMLLIFCRNLSYVSGLLDRWGTRNPEAEQVND